MNPKIKALVQQCWSHRVDGVLVDGHLHFDTAKFAELIVKECIHACVADIADPRDTIEFKCAKKIKEHFGVKE